MHFHPQVPTGTAEPEATGSGSGSGLGIGPDIGIGIGIGIGAGILSASARRRLSQGVDDPRFDASILRDVATVARWRAETHRRWGEGTVGDEPAHERAVIDGVPALLAGPADAPLVLLYLHGGGYVLGSAAVAAPITARFARRVRVVSIDYRLAPEHPFPAALDDAVAVYRALRRAHTVTPVAVAGDSAGGALALGVAYRSTLDAFTPPSAVVALCPHLDHDGPPERDGQADGDGPAEDDRTERDRTERDGQDGGAGLLAASYRATTDPRHPLLSPLHGDAALIDALPPTLIQTGTRDALHGQAVRFVRLARSRFAPVTLDLWEGLWHTWHYHRHLLEADQAVAEATRFLLQAAHPVAAAGKEHR